MKIETLEELKNALGVEEDSIRLTDLLNLIEEESLEVHKPGQIYHFSPEEGYELESCLGEASELFSTTVNCNDDWPDKSYHQPEDENRVRYTFNYDDREYESDFENRFTKAVNQLLIKFKLPYKAIETSHNDGYPNGMSSYAIELEKLKN